MKLSRPLVLDPLFGHAAEAKLIDKELWMMQKHGLVVKSTGVSERLEDNVVVRTRVETSEAA